MIINSKTLIGAPVRTSSGTALGKVASIDLDAGSGQLKALQVKTRGLVPGLMDHELSVSWDEIVEMTEKEVVVQDGTVPIGSRTLAMASESSGGVHLSERQEIEAEGATDA